MQRYRILHRTYYNFSGAVALGPHVLRLRPRESHELRIESSSLEISPAATLLWHRDVEDNSIATATFATPASQLSIESDVIIQQFNQAPLDFLVAGYAVDYPFDYAPEERKVLTPYFEETGQPEDDPLDGWIADFWTKGDQIQTYVLLQGMSRHIHESLVYTIREEPGVQSPSETLAKGSGSCRDFAALFIAAARRLGLAARFLGGYLNAPPSSANYGATHAWAEVYLPGAGWKGFDPTLGSIVGSDHIAVAVARLPESVPPIEGSFSGNPGAVMDVGVWVTGLT